MLSEQYKKTYDVKILTSLYIPSATFPFSVPIIYGEISSSNFILKQIKQIFFFSSFKFHNNTSIISFGFPSYYLFFKNNNVVWYCNTPNKFVYELNNYKDKIGILYPLAKLYTLIIKHIDNILVNNGLNIISNSNNIRNKLFKYMKYNNSDVIYPGVVMKINKDIKFKKNILCVSRLYKEKRINWSIDAMKYLPKYNLIIVGTGPEYDNLVSYAGKNVFLFGDVSSDILDKLYKECYCVIYTPKDEDFGLIVPEANSNGKYVIGVNEGGLSETIYPGFNGIFLDEAYPNKGLSIANNILKLKPKYQVEDCYNESKKYMFKLFYTEMEKRI